MGFLADLYPVVVARAFTALPDLFIGVEAFKTSESFGAFFVGLKISCVFRDSK